MNNLLLFFIISIINYSYARTKVHDINSSFNDITIIGSIIGAIIFFICLSVCIKKCKNIDNYT